LINLVSQKAFIMYSLFT